MALLSKEEMAEEMKAIDDSIAAHKAQMEIHDKMLKRENFLKVLVQEQLEKFK